MPRTASQLRNAGQQHPFWSETRHAWVDAVALRPGERVHALDGSSVVVLDVELRSATQVMRDLTVSEVHTYFVLVSDTPVLVHNCPTDPPETYSVGNNRADSSRQPYISRQHVITEGSNLEDGYYIFVVMRDESVRAIQEGVVPGGHSSLTRRRRVLTAGTFDVRNGVIVEYGNFSGHYWPGAHTRGTIERALGRAGFDLSRATWSPWTAPRRRS